MFLYITSVVYCRTFLHFLSSLFNNFRKLILRIYRSFKSLTCLKLIRKKFSTTLHTQFRYLTLPVTPFKTYAFISQIYTLKLIYNIHNQVLKEILFNLELNINILFCYSTMMYMDGRLLEW